MACKELLNRIKTYNNEFDFKRIEKAYNFADKAHTGQRRSSGEPYIIHPEETVNILVELKVDEDTIIAGLLHDVVEDTGISLKEIEKEFGKSVATLVNGVTKLTRFEYKKGLKSRHIASLRKMFLVMAKDLRVVLIKLADRLHNLQTLKYRPPEKIKKKCIETRDIYIPLSELLGIEYFKYQLEDLCFEWLKPDEYTNLKNHLLLDNEYLQTLITKVTQSLEDECMHHDINYALHTRLRHISSIFDKMQKEGKGYDEFNEKIIVEMETETIDDCYKMLGIVHFLWRPVPHMFKDLIAVPKHNQYSTLITQVFAPDGQIVEFHIYTKAMYLNAMYGVVSGFLDENNDKVIFNIKDLHWVKSLLKAEKTEDDDETFLNQLKLDIFQDRIAIYSPKGDVLDLPKGSTVIDFAYRVHSKLGHHLFKAKVNNNFVPLNHKLNTGDIVEIIKSVKFLEPNRVWLNFVTTNYAKQQIKRFLKSMPDTEKLYEGKRLLNNELQRFGIIKLPAKLFMKLKAIFGFEDLDDMYKKIAEAEISEKEVIQAIYNIEDLISEELIIDKKSEGEGTIYCIEMSVAAINRVGLMRDITYEISKLEVFAKYKMADLVSSSQNVIIKVCLEIKNLDDLYKVVYPLDMISGVRKVFF